MRISKITHVWHCMAGVAGIAGVEPYLPYLPQSQKFQNYYHTHHNRDIKLLATEVLSMDQPLESYLISIVINEFIYMINLESIQRPNMKKINGKIARSINRNKMGTPNK